MSEWQSAQMLVVLMGYLSGQSSGTSRDIQLGQQWGWELVELKGSRWEL